MAMMRNDAFAPEEVRLATKLVERYRHFLSLSLEHLPLKPLCPVHAVLVVFSCKCITFIKFW